MAAPAAQSGCIVACIRGIMGYRRIGHAGSFTCRAVTQKLETQNQKEDQILIRTTPDNAESEVFSDCHAFVLAAYNS